MLSLLVKLYLAGQTDSSLAERLIREQIATLKGIEAAHLGDDQSSLVLVVGPGHCASPKPDRARLGEFSLLAAD